MTTPPTISLLRVAGTHSEVGLQLGRARAAQIAREIDEAFAELPAGRTLEQQRTLAATYRAFTEPRLPWLIEELDGCAEGAGADPLDLFAWSMEEIWNEPLASSTRGRCSDLVAGPAATADGHLQVAHNNDLEPEVEPRITAIEKVVPGEPAIFQLGGVPWLSVGFNSAGLSLTGNELSPNDERVGISRSHQVLAIMRNRTLDGALAEALRPDRASSYNNVIASADGSVANVEGSATDAEVAGLDDLGHLAHTNHYACDRMRRYEGDPEYAVKSGARLGRAEELLTAAPPGSIDAGDLRAMLADHEGTPNEICRHPENGHPTLKTVFWCIADVTEGRILYGRGNPCASVQQEYVFTEYPGR